MTILEFFIPQSLHDVIKFTWIILMTIWPLSFWLTHICYMDRPLWSRALRYLGLILLFVILNNLVLTPVTEAIILGFNPEIQLDRHWNEEAPAENQPEAFPLPQESQ